MRSATNKTRLAGKRYRDKLKKDKKEYELNKRRTSIGRQNESNKEIKQNERKQKRENMVEILT